jgi:hypothetical protein
MGNPRLLTAYALGVAIVVGVIASLATGSWIALAIAIGVHFLASAFFLVFTMKRLTQEDKPDPVTEAHIAAGDTAHADDGTGGLTRSGRRGDREVVL